MSTCEERLIEYSGTHAYSSESVYLWPPEAASKAKLMGQAEPPVGLVFDDMGLYSIWCINGTFLIDTRDHADILCPHPYYEVCIDAIRGHEHPDVSGLLRDIPDEFNACLGGGDPGALMVAIERWLRSRGWVRVEMDENDQWCVVQ